MNHYKSFLAVTATAIGFLLAPGAANAFTFGGTITGEEAFEELGATIDVAAEGRIGDLSGAAEHEFNIHYDNPSGGQTVPTEYRRYDWVSGKGEDFSLSYLDDILTYEIGGETLTYNMSNNSLFNDLFIRTTARKQGSSVVVDNLFLDGTAIDGDSSFACEASRCGYWNSSEYLWLSDLGDSFTLTGTTTMSWLGNAKRLSDRTAPHRSELAFQLKLGNVEKPPVSVPEPISMSLFSVGAIGLALAGLRRQNG
ncbi:MAG: choice-of-anchor W domain-containing protein [Cyanobacteria bacterium J06592_8]